MEDEEVMTEEEEEKAEGGQQARLLRCVSICTSVPVK
jgi:hypothetical protein